jgi:hypothetical protein
MDPEIAPFLKQLCFEERDEALVAANRVLVCGDTGTERILLIAYGPDVRLEKVHVTDKTR